MKGEGHQVKRLLDIGPSEYTQDFLAFWNAYPRRVKKSGAFAAWKNARIDIETVLAALAWQTKTPDWQRDGGTFIPHPTTYLNQRRWEDEEMTYIAQQTQRYQLALDILYRMLDLGILPPEGAFIAGLCYYELENFQKALYEIE